MVTDADLAIQACLDQEIAAAFPDDGVLGEESGASAPRRLEATYVWVVDPIDGTNNFGRGIPGFSISVGVLRYGRPFCGAVYDPLGAQLWSALVGHGAWVNERPLRLSPPRSRPARSSASARPIETARPTSCSGGSHATGSGASARPRSISATRRPARWPSSTTSGPPSGTSRARPRW